jgi:hypothetical protein
LAGKSFKRQNSVFFRLFTAIQHFFSNKATMEDGKVSQENGGEKGAGLFFYDGKMETEGVISDQRRRWRDS